MLEIEKPMTIEALIAKPSLVGIYLKTYSVFFIFYFLKKEIGGMLAFPSKIFNLNVFFGGVDCRTMIGWNLSKYFLSVIFLYAFVFEKNWGECWHFLPNFLILIFF
jgi:hypothetical protein